MSVSPPQPKRRRRHHTLTAMTTDQLSNAGAATMPENQTGSNEEVVEPHGSADDMIEVAADGVITAMLRHRRVRRTLTPRKNVSGQSATAGTVTAPSSQPAAFGTNVAFPEMAQTMKRGRRRRALTAETHSDSDDLLSPASIGVVQTADNVEIAKLTSDGDEELPSFNMVNSSFSVGDLIWVKFRHYPFWPALVSCNVLINQ